MYGVYSDFNAPHGPISEGGDNNERNCPSYEGKGDIPLYTHDMKFFHLSGINVFNTGSFTCRFAAFLSVFHPSRTSTNWRTKYRHSRTIGPHFLYFVGFCTIAIGQYNTKDGQVLVPGDYSRASFFVNRCRE